jgi:hypothetical protein
MQPLNDGPPNPDAAGPYPVALARTVLEYCRSVEVIGVSPLPNGSFRQGRPLGAGEQRMLDWAAQVVCKALRAFLEDPDGHDAKPAGEPGAADADPETAD